PGNGAAGNYGVVRVAWPRSFENGQYKIGGGDSWVSIIEFGEKVKANVLLSYGNSTQEGSKHRGDQLQLFSDKKMRDALYYREDVEKNAQRIEVLHDGVFRNEQK
ncbi:MAG: penicillin acylase family protein, partial [Cyclobacteriaceae bacterium]|nr:penicillin acylase family protein [Cyclobacteriaceae bacterium]